MATPVGGGRGVTVKAKVVLLGEGAVGKTSLVLRYSENRFNDKHVQTLQASYVEKKLKIAGKRISLSIWDTAGQERYHALGPIYYRDSQGAIVVYDITDQDSFMKARNWIKELRRMLGDNIVVCIVGNKTDLEKNRTVNQKEAEDYAASVGAKHYHSSAKQSKGVQELFLDLSKRIIESQGSQSPTAGLTPQKRPNPGDEQMKQQMETFDAVLAKKGSLEQDILHCLFFGFPRAGKSSLMNRLSGQPWTALTPSTGVVTRAVPVKARRVSTSAVLLSPSDVTNACKWQYVSKDGEAAALIAAAVRESAKKDVGMQHEVSSDYSDRLQQSREERASIASSGVNDTSTSNSCSSFVSSASIEKPSPLNVLKDAVRRKGLRAVQEYLDKSMTLYLTDTGGQMEFQELLPTLVAGHFLFFLVFRLDEDLSKIFTVNYLHLDSSVAEPYQSSYTMRHTLLHSLASIAAMGTSDPTGAALTKPKVVFVGTHKDKVSQKRIRQIDLQLQKLVAPTAPYRDGLIQRASESQLMVAVNNHSGDDSDFTVIRSLVDRIASRGKFKVVAPSTWLTLSLYIRQLERQVISYDECLHIALLCGIESKEELNQALWFLHNKLGLVRYFRGAGLEELEDVVIIDPQILFDKITRLIVSTFTFQQASSAVHEEFKKKGIFPLDVLEEISRENEDELLTTPKFVKLLEHLNVIAPLHTTKAMFFMPCALAHVASTAQVLVRPRTLLDYVKQFFSFFLSASTESDRDSISISFSVPPPLLVTFKCGYVPRGLFGALAVFLLANKVKSSNTITLQKDKIFRNSITFAFGPLDFVTLTTESNYLEVAVVPSNPEMKRVFPISDTCTEVRRCIDFGIRRVMASLNYTRDAAHTLAFYCDRPHEGVKELHPAVLQLHREEPCSICCEVTGTKLVYEPPKGCQLWFSKDDPVKQQETTQCSEFGSSTPSNLHQVDATELVSSDLSAVLNAVGSLAAHWSLLGLSLGLPPYALEVIEVDYIWSRERLCEVLKAWLAGHGSPPCWRGLVAAVASPTGGDSASLAQEIASHHLAS